MSFTKNLPYFLMAALLSLPLEAAAQAQPAAPASPPPGPVAAPGPVASPAAPVATPLPLPASTPATAAAPAAPLPLPATAGRVATPSAPNQPPLPAAAGTAAIPAPVIPPIAGQLPSAPTGLSPSAVPAVPPGPADAPKIPATALPVGSDDDTSNIPSIMFKPEIIEGLDRAIAVAASNAEKAASATTPVVDQQQPKMDDDIMDQLVKLQPKEKNVVVEKTFPIFFLNSIIYQSPAQWSAWINGVRFTNKNNKPEHAFFITGIAKDHVTVLWKPVGVWPELMALWHKNNMADTQHAISLDETAGTISFTLRPNQTFLTQVLQIHEGHYMPYSNNLATGTPP